MSEHSDLQRSTSFLSDCLETPEPKRAQLLEERKKKIREGKGMERLIADANAQKNKANSTEQQDGLIAAKLCDTVHVSVSGNYGADHAALSDAHLEQLELEDMFVLILPLNQPVAMALAADGSEEPYYVTATCIVTEGSVAKGRGRAG